MELDELKELLEFKTREYNTIDFIESDPIQIPHKFDRKEDIEIAGLLVSTIAWGNRKMIIKSGNNLLKIMGNSPYDYVMNYSSERLPHFVHRTFNREDLDFFFRSLQNIYQNEGLECAFSTSDDLPGVKGRIVNFRSRMLETRHADRSVKHLSNPLKNSAAKRINMFLRWMVRDDKNGVDFGIWNSVSPAELCIPLDVHTGNTSRQLGIITRKQDDWKALDEIMAILRQFDPEDPAKYDFALFGLGAFEGIK